VWGAGQREPWVRDRVKEAWSFISVRKEIDGVARDDQKQQSTVGPVRTGRRKLKGFPINIEERGSWSDAKGG